MLVIVVCKVDMALPAWSASVMPLKKQDPHCWQNHSVDLISWAILMTRGLSSSCIVYSFWSLVIFILSNPLSAPYVFLQNCVLMKAISMFDATSASFFCFRPRLSIQTIEGYHTSSNWGTFYEITGLSSAKVLIHERLKKTGEVLQIKGTLTDMIIGRGYRGNKWWWKK